MILAIGLIFREPCTVGTYRASKSCHAICSIYSAALVHSPRYWLREIEVPAALRLNLLSAAKATAIRAWAAYLASEILAAATALPLACTLRASSFMCDCKALVNTQPDLNHRKYSVAGSGLRGQHTPGPARVPEIPPNKIRERLVPLF